MTATRDTAPFVMVGTTPALTVNASGASVLLPSSSIVNPFNDPIEVTEITSMVLAQSGAAWIYDVSLRAGRHDLTNGFCPIPVLAPRYDTEEEGPVITAANTALAATARWILPKPMILPAGAAITGAFRVNPTAPGNTGIGINGSTSTLTVIATARRIPRGSPKSKTTCIPFASGAIYAPAAGTSVAGPVANDLQLMNTLGVPLYLRQINAAPLYASAAFGILTLTGMVITGPGGVLGTPRRIVADGIPQAIFAQRDSIEIDHVLNPGESYKVTTSGVLNTTAIAVAISGYREEAL